jgi:hypothetical protein
MHTSHGAILAIAEIVLALYETNDQEIIHLYYQNTSALAPLVANLPPKSLVTFGSEQIREAACHLITNLSKTQIKADNSLDDWKKMIHSSLERKEESVHQAAVLAFGAVAATYGLNQTEMDLLLQKIEVQNPYGRRGYSLAVGTINYTGHLDWLHSVIIKLCQASQVQVNCVYHNFSIHN